MNGKSKHTITLVSLLLGLALIVGGCASSGETAPEQGDQPDLGSQSITESQERVGDRDTPGDDESARSLPPADDRGTGPLAGRVDTPPRERDNPMDPRTRRDHLSSTALIRESRDLREDYRRPNDTQARVDSASDASNRGFQRDRAANDQGGGGSLDKTGDRTGSAEDSLANLATLDRRDIAVDQPDSEIRAAMAKKGDSGGLKREAAGNSTLGISGGKTESAMAAPPRGEMVVVRRRWAKIRRAPRENSRSIALVYGNDTFQVVNTEGEWVQVRFGRNNRHKGWLPLSDLSR